MKNVSGNLELYLFRWRNQQLQDAAIERFTVFNVTNFSLMRQAIPPLLIRAEHHIISHRLLRTWRTTTMIGGDHSALSYKLPAGGKVGGTLNYPLYQNKISLLHDLQSDIFSSPDYLIRI